jgi:hypothetical protein
MEGLKKNTKDFRQDIRFIDRQLNLALPNITRSVTATLTLSVKNCDGREKENVMIMIL